MTRRDGAHRDRADELDQAIDALIRGDYSGLDDLPPELAATVDRIFWLAQESDDILEGAGAPRYNLSPSSTGYQRLHMDGSDAEPHWNTPASVRTLKTTGAGTAAEGASSGHVSRRARHFPTVLRFAAVVLVLMMSAGAVYGLLPLMDEFDVGNDPSHEDGDLRLVQLLPGQCPAIGMNRQEVLEILRDVDAERDAELRRSIKLAPVDDWMPPVDGLNFTFHNWLACRRFGNTYEAMAYEAPHFIREDLYGDTSLGYRNPNVSPYSDDTLNEMLDKRYAADMQARRHFETTDVTPDPAETPVLGGEMWVSSDTRFVAIRAMQFNVKSEGWHETPMVVVFQQVGEQYLLFDILSVPSGHPPYSCYDLSSANWPESRTDEACLDGDEFRSDP